MKDALNFLGSFQPFVRFLVSFFFLFFKFEKRFPFPFTSLYTEFLSQILTFFLQSAPLRQHVVFILSS